jgi:endonuclease/exonuclease/phosphatase family metal-dependent hydrolase
MTVRLRVVSYNIHKCIGGVDRRYDPGRVVATLAHHEPDIVLLQEVDRLAKRSNHDYKWMCLASAWDFAIVSSSVTSRSGAAANTGTPSSADSPSPIRATSI